LNWSFRSSPKLSAVTIGRQHAAEKFRRIATRRRALIAARPKHTIFDLQQWPVYGYRKNEKPGEQ